MLVGDIYGDRDYSNIGLSASTIACSFGKVIAGPQAVLCEVPVYLSILTGSPIDYANRLIGSPITSQSTVPASHAPSPARAAVGSPLIATSLRTKSFSS